jgi:nucleotide-binding universal stress UspA family protein
MYSKILVPYDGSEPSNNALIHAINLARTVTSINSKESSMLTTDNTIATTSRLIPEVVLLYVIEEIHAPPSFDYGMKIRVKSPLDNEEIKTTDEYLKEVYYNMKFNAMEMLNKKKMEYSTSNISISTDVVTGRRPADRIIEFASNNKVDLIVMGTHGLSGIFKRIKALGSVSRAVTEKANCPVLLVP